MIITVPAAAINGQPGVYSQNFSETGISITSASGSFTVQVGTQTPIPGTVGMNLGFSIGQPLGRVEFINAGSSDVQITTGPYGAARQNAVSADVSTFAGALSGPYNFGSSQPTQLFPGVDSSGRQRKVIYVCNFALAVSGGSINNDVLVVASAGLGKIYGIVYPQTTETFETNADLVIAAFTQSLSGQVANQQGSVLDIFYAKALQTDV